MDDTPTHKHTHIQRVYKLHHIRSTNTSFHCVVERSGPSPSYTSVDKQIRARPLMLKRWWTVFLSLWQPQVPWLWALRQTHDVTSLDLQWIKNFKLYITRITQEGKYFSFDLSQKIAEYFKILLNIHLIFNPFQLQHCTSCI